MCRRQRKWTTDNQLDRGLRPIESLINFLRDDKLEPDVKMDMGSKPSSRMETVKAIVRGLVPEECEGRASACINMEGVEEDFTTVLKILREITPVQVVC